MFAAGCAGVTTVVLVAGLTFRRLVSPRSVLLAGSGGLLAGLLTLGLPSPALVHDVFRLVSTLLAALLVLPLVAALPASDRRGGYEQLQGCRPISSLAWASGRVLGSLVAGVLLALLLVTVAQELAGRRQVPRRLVGLRTTEAGETWRFSLPAGAQGPFDLCLETFVPFAGSGELELTTQRAAAREVQTLTILPVREHIAVVSDLAPQRGDLYVTLAPRRGTLLGGRPPELVVGSEPLQASALVLSRRSLGRLVFALLVVLAAAHAFHFETACLAGLLALVVTPPQGGLAWGLSLSGCLGFAALGSALLRRQALP